MSSSAKAVTFWKGHVKKTPRSALLAIGLTVIAALLFFKAKPYFTDNPIVQAFIRETDHTKKSETVSRLDNLNLLPNETRISGGRGSQGAVARRAGISRASVPKILERPLFDGKSVTLKVRLSTALDSESGDANVEGQILGVVDSDLAGSMDAASVKFATLRGSATPNFDTKRYMTQFRELLTSEGKLITLTGVAYTPDDTMLGVPSDYSSGLPSRLIGTALNRVIVAADVVAENHVLDEGSGSAVDRELSRMARQGSSETANGLGDEASKGLRETKAALSVRAGTIIYVKVQAAHGTGGAR